MLGLLFLYPLSQEIHLLVNPAHRSRDSSVLYLLALLTLSKFLDKTDSPPPHFSYYFSAVQALFPPNLVSLGLMTPILYSITFWRNTFLRYVYIFPKVASISNSSNVHHYMTQDIPSLLEIQIKNTGILEFPIAEGSKCCIFS